MKYCWIILCSLLFVATNAFAQKDKAFIDSLNAQALSVKNQNYQAALKICQKTISFLNDITYPSGKAETFRILGIIYQNLGKRDSALYYNSKSYEVYNSINDTTGIAKSLNNLGNFYRNFNVDKALSCYHMALKRSNNKLNVTTAGCYLNIGILYKSKKDFQKALIYYKRAYKLFSLLNNPKGITISATNIGNINLELKDTIAAKKKYSEAQKIAIKNNFLFLIANVNNNLAKVYLDEGLFEKAKYLLSESKKITQNQDENLYYDCIHNFYLLEKAQKNYKTALNYLEEINYRDSLYYEESTKSMFQLAEENQKNLEKQKQYELSLEKARNNRIIFLATIVVTLLSFVLIFILIKSKRKTEKNNLQLVALNQEISNQKEDLNRINTRLEEIIEDRTKDLLIKNQKLSEYSSHLSHQIRGPVATIKGLLILVSDDLINKDECFDRMKKCVEDIDDQIMDINLALHDSKRISLEKKDEQS